MLNEYKEAELQRLAAQKLYEMRKDMGIRQNDMAYLLGHSVNTLRRWETGEGPMPVAIFIYAMRMYDRWLKNQNIKVKV